MSDFWSRPEKKDQKMTRWCYSHGWILCIIYIYLDMKIIRVIAPSNETWNEVFTNEKIHSYLLCVAAAAV